MTFTVVVQGGVHPLLQAWQCRPYNHNLSPSGTVLHSSMLSETATAAALSAGAVAVAAQSDLPALASKQTAQSTPSAHQVWAVRLGL